MSTITSCCWSYGVSVWQVIYGVDLGATFLPILNLWLSTTVNPLSFPFFPMSPKEASWGLYYFSYMWMTYQIKSHQWGCFCLLMTPNVQHIPRVTLFSRFYIQKDLDSLHSWSINNSIFFNLKKSVLLNFGQRPSRNAWNLTFKDKPIPLVDHHKDLGVVFSHDLTWSAQYSRIISATYKTLHVVRHCLSVRNCVQTKKNSLPIPH